VFLGMLAACLSSRVDGSPEQADRYPLPVERVAKGLKKTPALRVTLDRRLPVATFRLTVEQHQVMLPFLEQFRKEFALTDLQRQSQDWSSRCCGVNTPRQVESLNKALQRRDARRIRSG